MFYRMHVLILFSALLASSGVYCEDEVLEAPTSPEPFRLAIILTVVAVVLVAAGIIVGRFICVNFCESKGRYDEVGNRDNDASSDVIVLVADDTNTSSSLVVPRRYSHVSIYSQMPDIQEQPEAERAAEASPITHLTDTEITNDRIERADSENDILEPEGREDADHLLPPGREDEAHSSGDDGGSPGTSNGTPPPPYDEARSLASSDDRLDEIEDSPSGNDTTPDHAEYHGRSGDAPL